MMKGVKGELKELKENQRTSDNIFASDISGLKQDVLELQSGTKIPINTTQPPTEDVNERVRMNLIREKLTELNKLLNQ